MRVVIAAGALELHQGGITQQQVDAVVNAANSRLAGGGGVDGAVHRRGGPAIMAETRRRYPHGCPTGSAVISAPGLLPVKHVIHAVGPVWQGGSSGEAEQLAGAYRTSFELAWQHNCESVALPAMSTGAYGYPLDAASRVALATAIEFIESHELPALVRFVLFDADAYETFAATLAALTSER